MEADYGEIIGILRELTEINPNCRVIIIGYLRYHPSLVHFETLFFLK